MITKPGTFADLIADFIYRAESASKEEILAGMPTGTTNEKIHKRLYDMERIFQVIKDKDEMYSLPDDAIAYMDDRYERPKRSNNIVPPRTPPEFKPWTGAANISARAKRDDAGPEHEAHYLVSGTVKEPHIRGV